MKPLNDNVHNHLKERTICIRISPAQEEVIRAAMERDGVRFLSRFVRIAVLDLAERVLAPVDLDEFRKDKQREEERARLRRALQDLELQHAAKEPMPSWSGITELIRSARHLLDD